MCFIANLTDKCKMKAKVRVLIRWQNYFCLKSTFRKQIQACSKPLNLISHHYKRSYKVSCNQLNSNPLLILDSFHYASNLRVGLNVLVGTSHHHTRRNRQRSNIMNRLYQN
ncbi:hypothetical protein AAZV13_01G092000 [Glycine max]